MTTPRHQTTARLISAYRRYCDRKELNRNLLLFSQNASAHPFESGVGGGKPKAAGSGMVELKQANLKDNP